MTTFWQVIIVLNLVGLGLLTYIVLLQEARRRDDLRAIKQYQENLDKSILKWMKDTQQDLSGWKDQERARLESVYAEVMNKRIQAAQNATSALADFMVTHGLTSVPDRPKNTDWLTADVQQIALGQHEDMDEATVVQALAQLLLRVQDRQKAAA